MTIDNSVQNSTQNLAGINSEGSKPIMSKIDPSNSQLVEHLTQQIN